MAPGLCPQVVDMMGISALGAAKATAEQASNKQTNVPTMIDNTLVELRQTYFPIKIIRPFV